MTRESLQQVSGMLLRRKKRNDAKTLTNRQSNGNKAGKLVCKSVCMETGNRAMTSKVLHDGDGDVAGGSCVEYIGSRLEDEELLVCCGWTTAP